MNSQPAARSKEIIRQEQSFPLIAMMQLGTFCVALVTCIDFKELARLMKRVPNTELLTVIAPFVAAGLLGFVIGGAIGLGQIRKGRSFIVCGAAGGLVSLVILGTLAAPAPPTQAIAACLLPLVSTLVLRFRTR